jgi:hypothetical protein
VPIALQLICLKPFSQGRWQFMSAALLRNNKKCNELEDDRESCLHVLTWTALRFTKHTCSEGDSSMFLRAFDDEYEDQEGVKGGDLKRDLSQHVKYHTRSSSTVGLSWTPSLKSLPRRSPFITRSLRRTRTSKPSKT